MRLVQEQNLGGLSYEFIIVPGAHFFITKYLLEAGKRCREDSIWCQSKLHQVVTNKFN